jgi:hypothetical protein
MKLVALPKVLADALDSYYQTSKFARQHFIRFNKELVYRELNAAASRLGYTMSASEGKNAGQFVFTRASKTLRVTRDTFPQAELRASV